MKKIKELVSVVMRPEVVEVLLVVAAMAVIGWMIHEAMESAVELATAIVAGVSGGKHVVDGPLTTTQTEVASPGLLRSEIDRRVTRIRPMATPIDQISRSAGARRCGSMKVEYYSVDTMETCSALKEAVDTEEFEGDASTPIEIKPENVAIFHPTETILVPGVTVTSRKSPLVLYVAEKREIAGVLTVKVVNELDAGEDFATIVGKLVKGVKLIRMGRAAAELDVQTAQYSALPSKSSNFCQIFKAQVEESTFQKIANKEVGWSFSDQEEVAIVDMRRGMEKNFLFGTAARFTDPVKKEEVFVTGGIWAQAGKEFSYKSGAMTGETLVDLCRAAFTGQGGSSRKILVGGSGLIERLNKLEYSRVISAGDKVTKWGIDFSEINSKFGSLYVVLSEVFDECGHENDGMVIDPEYITKYSHVPFKTERLDLKKSGVRNTDAVVITEASCLVLRYPNAHLRIVAG